MVDIQAVKNEASTLCKKYIAYSSLCRGSREAAYILSDSKPLNKGYGDFSHCYIKKLQNNYGQIMLDLPCVDYVVFDPIGDVMGIIHEYQTPAKLIDPLLSKVDYYDKFLTVDKDEFALISCDNKNIIHVECVEARVTKKCIFEHGLICSGVDSFLREVKDAIQYTKWLEFKEQTSEGFDFEEED